MRVQLIRNRLRPLLLAAVLASSGCLVLPIPTPEDKVLAGTPVSQEQLAFVSTGIERGVTTRADVVAHLGAPSLIWEDARVFVYQWDMRQGMLFVVIGYGGGVGDIPRHHWVLVQFDEQDRVVRSEYVTRTWSGPRGEFLRKWAGVPTPPTPAKSIVLVHIRCTVDNAPDYSHGNATGCSRLVGIGDAGFESGGLLRAMRNRFVSTQAQDEDWAYFERPPGTYYVAVAGPDSGPAWVDVTQGPPERMFHYRIDVPEQAGVVYVGTLELTGTVTGKMTFGVPHVEPRNADALPVVDERDGAVAVAAEHFADKPFETALMTPWQTGQPLVLRGR